MKNVAKVAGITMMVFALTEPISALFGHAVDVPTWVFMALIGLGIYGLSLLHG